MKNFKLKAVSVTLLSALLLNISMSNVLAFGEITVSDFQSTAQTGSENQAFPAVVAVAAGLGLAVAFATGFYEGYGETQEAEAESNGLAPFLEATRIDQSRDFSTFDN